MSNQKEHSSEKNPKLDENGKPKPKPLLPVLTEPEIRTANLNKIWLDAQQKFNDYDFALFPLGDRGFKEIEKAYGAYPHRNASPIMFHDPDFKTKFMSFEGNDIFHRYAGEWDFSMRGTPKNKSQGFSEQVFNDKLAKFHASARLESKKIDNVVNQPQNKTRSI